MHASKWCGQCEDHGTIEVDANLDDARECDPHVIACLSCPRCGCGELLLYHEELRPELLIRHDGRDWDPFCLGLLFDERSRAEQEAEDRAALWRGIDSSTQLMTAVALAALCVVWWLR